MTSSPCMVEGAWWVLGQARALEILLPFQAADLEQVADFLEPQTSHL